MPLPYSLSHVEQEDTQGCMIACLAMICGLSYHRAKAEMFPRRRVFRDTSALRVDDARCTRALTRLGFTWRLADSYQQKRFPAFVSFPWEPKDPKSPVHCVVWDPRAQSLMDPADATRYMSHLDKKEAMELWLESDWQVILVTGKK